MPHTCRHPHVVSLNQVWSVADLDYIPMTQPGAAAGGGVTDAELRATPIGVMTNGDFPFAVTGVVSAPTYTTAMGEYIGINPTYLGMAVLGSSKGSASWQIRKLTYVDSNVTDIQYADGSATFDKVWDSRTGYSYS